MQLYFRKVLFVGGYFAPAKVTKTLSIRCRCPGQSS